MVQIGCLKRKTYWSTIKDIKESEQKTQNNKYLPTPLHEQDATLGQFLKQSLTDLNSELSFTKTSCHTKVTEIFIGNGKTNESR